MAIQLLPTLKTSNTIVFNSSDPSFHRIHTSVTFLVGRLCFPFIMPYTAKSSFIHFLPTRIFLSLSPCNIYTPLKKQVLSVTRLYYKIVWDCLLVCPSVRLSVCSFVSPSVFHMYGARGPMDKEPTWGWFVHKKFPGGGDITKEPMRMFDVDYVPQDSISTIVSNITCIFHDCSELCQTVNVHTPSYSMNASRNSFVQYERFTKLLRTVRTLHETSSCT